MLKSEAGKQLDLSRNEKGAILDVLNGTILDEATADMNLVDAFTGRQIRPGLGGQIAHNVLDACEGDGLAEKWQIDGPYLVAKLEGLSKEDGARLYRGARAWWDRVSNGEQPDFDELDR